MMWVCMWSVYILMLNVHQIIMKVYKLSGYLSSCFWFINPEWTFPLVSVEMSEKLPMIILCNNYVLGKDYFTLQFYTYLNLYTTTNRGVKNRHHIISTICGGRGVSFLCPTLLYRTFWRGPIFTPWCFVSISFIVVRVDKCQNGCLVLVFRIIRYPSVISTISMENS